MNILYQFDECYAAYAAVSMTSLFENNKNSENITIYVLGDHIQEQSLLKFKELEEQYGRKIIFLPTEQLEHQIKEMGMPPYRGSYAANMRLFISELMPEETERLLYLDSDTIVSGSLEELFTMDLKGAPAAMVQDSLVRNHKRNIGLSKDTPYFNSGMILYDIRQWKRNRCSERMASHVQQVRASYPNPDQDLINVVLGEEILAISPKYNFQPIHVAFSLKWYDRIYHKCGYYDTKQIEEAKKDIRVYHFFRFIGEFPWNEGNIHPDRELFLKYLEISPFSGMKLVPKQKSIVYETEKNLYRMLPEGLFLWIFRMAHEYFTFKENRNSLKGRK